MLDDAGFRVLQIDLALGPGGARKGDLLLAFPAIGRGPAPRPAPGADGHDALHEQGALADAARWKAELERAVQQVPATLDAVLHRLTLPLSAVLAFSVGTELPVPLAALEEMRLEGLGGRSVGRGRLGQNRGFRAVRLAAETEDTAPASADPPPLGTAETPRATPRRKPEPARPPVPAPADLAEPFPMAMPIDLAGDHLDETPEMPALKIGSAVS